MIYTHNLLSQRVHASAGLWAEPPKKIHKLADLEKSEWSPEFERLMRNRLLLGALRYGLLGARGKPQWDRVDSIKRRLKLYGETGNVECLVDIANMALLEFVEGKHPNRHFSAADDPAEHSRISR